MDFNYAPPPRGKRSTSANAVASDADRRKLRRFDYSDFADLPTHLPNTALETDTSTREPDIPVPIVSAAAQKTTQARAGESHEQKASSSCENEPIFIEGTNISLQTEEDVAKWIAERRKNWPTRKNIALKEKLKQERVTADPVTEPKRAVCKFFAKTGRCKFGNKCRNLHESTSGPSASKTINGIAVNIPQRYSSGVTSTGSLFTKLVQRDLYEHENNKIIEFLEYLNSKGLIDLNAAL